MLSVLPKMNAVEVPGRSNRAGIVILLLTLVIAGLEVWGIRASLGILFR